MKLLKYRHVNVVGGAKLSDLVDGNCEIIHESLRGLIVFMIMRITKWKWNMDRIMIYIYNMGLWNVLNVSNINEGLQI